MLPGLRGAMKPTKLEPLKKGDPNEQFRDTSSIETNEGYLK